MASGRDVDGRPLRLLVAAAQAISVVALVALVLGVTELMNVLPVFYFNIVSWPQALVFVLAVALWYWVLAFVAAPRVARGAQGVGGSGARVAVHAGLVALVFGLVHVLNHHVFVTGIQISVWSELDLAVICHALAWLLWMRGSRPRVPAAGAAR